MTTSSTHTLDLAEQAGPPADGVLSRTVFQDDRPKALGFDLAQGQEPSEHTAAKPAVLLFRRGEKGVGLSDVTRQAQGEPGSTCRRA